MRPECRFNIQPSVSLMQINTPGITHHFHPCAINAFKHTSSPSTPLFPITPPLLPPKSNSYDAEPLLMSPATHFRPLSTTPSSGAGAPSLLFPFPFPFPSFSSLTSLTSFTTLPFVPLSSFSSFDSTDFRDSSSSAPLVGTLTIFAAPPRPTCAVPSESLLGSLQKNTHVSLVHQQRHGPPKRKGKGETHTQQHPAPSLPQSSQY